MAEQPRSHDRTVITRAATSIEREAGTEVVTAPLGVGISYFRAIHDVILDCRELIDVVEIEPQSLWFRSTRGSPAFRIDEAQLDALRALPFTKLMHGIGFAVGGTLPPDEQQIPPLQRLARDLSSPWISEHLSFNRARGEHGTFATGFLLPPRQTRAGAAAAAASVRAMSDALPLPMLVETGVNYLRARDDECTDGCFVRSVCESAGCGILLDLHNAWTNARNGRQPLDDFFRELPLERVVEVHLAGGFEYRGYWLDSHSGAIPAELVEIAHDVVPRLPNLRALIFELFPSYAPFVGPAQIRRQMELLRELWQSRAHAPPPRTAATECATAQSDVLGPRPDEWEDVLGALVVDRSPTCALAVELARDPGLGILRELLREFRASMITSVLTLTSRLLMLHLGAGGLRELMGRFWTVQTPLPFASDEALAFAEFLGERLPDVPHLDEVLAYERAAIWVALERESRVVPFHSDPLMLLRSLADGRRPEDIPQGHFEVEITA